MSKALSMQSIKACANLRPADHPDVAMGANNLANLYVIQRRFGDAEPLFQKALVINERAFGPDHPRVAMTLGTYAALLRKTGRGRDAAHLDKRAKEIRLRQTNHSSSGRAVFQWS